MTSVIEFIEATKGDETATVERVETTLTDSEKRSQRSRQIIITLIVVLSLLAAALLCHVVWHTFSLIAV